MVALVEQRAALALQNYPCPGTPAPMVSASVEQGGPAKGLGSKRRSGGGDCSRIAEAVAHFEAQRDSPPAKGLRKEEQPGPGPGEVRIAFPIPNGREPQAPDDSLPNGSSCWPVVPTLAAQAPGPEPRTRSPVTCTSSSAPLGMSCPAMWSSFLALADEASEGGTTVPARPEDIPPVPPPAPAQDCGASGFHVDVVVTGVDECIFFGKDGTKNVKEETVCLTVSPEEPPPPYSSSSSSSSSSPGVGTGPPSCPQPTPSPPLDDAEGTADTSLCRLYRHVSHDFLEIRFKIQRLLEPPQYMLLLPEQVLVKVFSFLPTRALAALKCTCHHLKGIIEAFGVRATDSHWSRDPLYGYDPWKQCRKRYEKGDLLLCS